MIALNVSFLFPYLPRRKNKFKISLLDIFQCCHGLVAQKKYKK